MTAHACTEDQALKRDRAGQYSIRINDQWRICFVWKDGNAHDVEIAKDEIATELEREVQVLKAA